MSSRVVLANLRVHVGISTIALQLAMPPNAVLFFLGSALLYSSSKERPILKLLSGSLGLDAL